MLLLSSVTCNNICRLSQQVMHNFVQEEYDISSYSTVVGSLGFPASNLSSKYKHWLGIADPKTVFRFILTYSKICNRI